MSKSNANKAKKSITKLAKSKSELVISLLRRPIGASISEMMKSTGWQSHSVRGFLAGSLKKKGQLVSSSKDQKGVRRYRLDGVVNS